MVPQRRIGCDFYFHFPTKFLRFSVYFISVLLCKMNFFIHLINVIVVDSWKYICFLIHILIFVR